MKRNGLRMGMMTLGMAAMLMCANLFSSYGAGNSPDPYQVGRLKAAKEADQLILVVGGEGYDVTVSYYKKEGNGLRKGPGEMAESWTEVFTTKGVYGKNGASAEKREGDGKTPVGTYQFTMAFGLKENPGSVLPYHQIRQGDYWVDDSGSAYYNQLVNTKETTQDWNSAEDMAASAPFYNYGLVLDYNKDCVPGAGSAIFMHCTKSEADTGSQGCIRIPEELMKQVIQSVNETSRIVIVTDASQLEYDS